MKIENFNIILIFCFYCFSFCEDKAMNGNNSNYWPQNNDMNFPTIQNAFADNISWEPGDSIFIILKATTLL